jgi:hypothetical protein
MADYDQRRKTRVQCRIPARIVVPSCWPPLTVEDVSAEGVRLAIRIGRDDCGGDLSLGALARKLETVLGMRLHLEFDPDRLGSLVTRNLRIVRIARSDESEDLLVVGCVLEPPLTPEEGAFLGVPLPAAAEAPPPTPAPPPRRDAPPPFRTGSVAQRAAAAPQGAQEAAASWRASVVARTFGSGQTLHGRVERIDAEGGRLWVVEPPEQPLSRQDLPLVNKVIAFEHTYGADVDVAIEDGPRFLWYGPVRLTAVETRQSLPGRLALDFRFQRRLETGELTALGLS